MERIHLLKGLVTQRKKTSQYLGCIEEVKITVTLIFSMKERSGSVLFHNIGRVSDFVTQTVNRMLFLLVKLNLLS